MAIDPNSHVPIYRQIVEHICGLVAAGVHRPGEALPSVRALAAELVVNPNTIQRAYQELERGGLVEKRRGLGVFVSRGGVNPAREQTVAAMYERFLDGIELGKRTRMGLAGIRTVFQRAMSDEQSLSRGAADATKPGTRDKGGQS